MLVIPSLVDNNVMGLVPKPIIDKWYLFYWMQQFDLRKVSNIGPVPSMRKTEVERVTIPLPSLSEQRRIVKILHLADKVRKKRNEADSKAEQILSVLFYDLFGSPSINPKKWDRDILGSVIMETQYGLSLRADSDSNGVAILRMNNIDYSGYLNLDDLKYVQLDEADLIKYRLERGDILFNRTNSKELVGKTGLWNGEIEAVPASYLIKIKVKRDRVFPEYIWAYMNTPYMKEILLNQSRRAIGMANINAQELRVFPVLIPDLDLQKAYSKKLAVIMDLRKSRSLSADKLNNLFSILLYKAFSGELTAEWREAHMKELLAEMEEQAKYLEAARMEGE